MEIYVVYGVLFIGFIVVLLKLFKKDRSAEEKYEAQYNEQYDKTTNTKSQLSTNATSAVNQQQQPQSAVSNKTAKRSNLKKRSDKNNFNHNWLLTTLKSHTGSVLDISFSSNGKYLATSADDSTSMTIIDGNSTSSSSESTSPKISKRKPRKNNNRRASQNNNNNNNNNYNNNNSNNNNNNSNNNSNNNNNNKMTSAKYMSSLDIVSSFRALQPPLRQHTKLNISEAQLITYLRNYILDENLQRQLGFPMEYDCAPNLAIIYKYPPYEFAPLRKRNNVKQLVTPASAFLNMNDGLNKGQFGSDTTDSDSGQGSGSSSPSAENEYHVNTNAKALKQVIPKETKAAKTISEKECSRCAKGFYVTENGEYLKNEACFYHPGKLYKTYSPQIRNCVYTYTCCNREPDDTGLNGCSLNLHHVWSGITSGMNGPYEGYVRTEPRPFAIPEDGNTGVFSVDCEMCYTGCGLELTKVTIVRSDGNLFYESFVRPEREIVDYNTRFSGITEKDLVYNNSYNNVRRTSNTSSRSSNSSSQSHDCDRVVKTIQEVQKDLLKFIFDDTILIGHAIENDLKALKLIHKTVIDTSIAFPHHSGLPFRRSLKSLTKTFLQRDIQESSNGHCSFEDSRACLDLILWKIRTDYRQILEQY